MSIDDPQWRPRSEANTNKARKLIFFSDEKIFRFGQFYFTEQAGDDKATPTVNSGL